MTDEQTPRFPAIRIPLVGEDGNAFAIIGRCAKAMRPAGCTETEREQFYVEAMSGDYDHVLQTVMRWFRIS